MQLYEVFNTEKQSDSSARYTSGTGILPDGRLIVIDYYNKCVEMFDTDNQLIAQTQLEGNPTDLTIVCSDQVIVLVELTFDRLFQFVDVKDNSLIPGYSFQTSNMYKEIAYCRDQIVAADNTDFTIKVLDMSGRILRTLDKSPHWRGAIAVNATDGVIYSINARKISVTCMRIEDGEILSVYKQEQETAWDKMAVHPDGSVYICDYDSSNIHHFTSQCTHIETLQTSGWLRRPGNICCHPDGNRLYVSNERDGWGTIKVFTLGN